MTKNISNGKMTQKEMNAFEFAVNDLLKEEKKIRKMIKKSDIFKGKKLKYI